MTHTIILKKKKTKTTSILAVPDELTGQVAQPHNCGRQQVLLLGECDNLHSFTIPMGPYHNNIPLVLN